MNTEEPCTCRKRPPIRQAVLDWGPVIMLIIEVLQHLG